MSEISQNILDDQKVSDIKKIDAALDLMNSAEKNLGSMFSGLTKVITTIRNDLIQLEKEKEDLEKIKKKNEREISGLNEEQSKLLVEYEKIRGELKAFSKVASGADVFDIANIKGTLAIYRVLLEKIWQSHPHYTILNLLHGKKKIMTIDELKLSSGIGGAFALRAAHDLANVKLITFDIDTKECELVQRLFPEQKD